jgi:chloramphenicol 3-O-phosphotransferase
LEQRERDRGDRMVGQGRGHAHLIHQWPTYDVEIDTSVGTPQAAASTIVHAVRQLALLRSASDRSLSTDQDVH